ncbi:MAG: DEAD/DEAH box helicase family protein [Myxococcales bacterium]|nr:DEAD/DEAH box helicase family protein [Myxococcales bacterium]
MITLEAARELLDFGTRIGRGSRADEQLKGAVALHNILRKQRVAYLADEVGMGKTYVALGALALFRHFDPNFRVLIIAPRENIQSKWQKELSNFVANNVRFSDLRVRAIDGRPSRALVSCRDLIELVREVSLDPNRDFFTRMTSFSLMLGKNADDWRRKRDELREVLPWLQDDALDLRSNKDLFKRNVARAICCALPPFDLVIVDEAHNLKHGLQSSSARNRVLAETFGRQSDADPPSTKMFPGYGPRAKRVLFLSATPLEETYRHIWNQLDLFGMADGFDDLKADIPEARKKEVAAQFLVRRVTSIRIADVDHTKNMYRREWRAGGVLKHDDPIRIEDERQRLIVALVQKKVSELLGGKNFKRSFQIGMLASFESFLETTRLKRDTEEETTFDDAGQTDEATERDGLDVRDLNLLARDYRKTFDRELPHPKMDALVDGLSSTWQTGRKALVFVRRVASVKEIKRKLDERYDAWLLDSLRTRLPPAMQPELERLVERYKREKHQAADTPGSGPEDRSAEKEGKLDDSGGNDTFFAWFFRGEGPKGYVSGANIQARFIQASSAYATFFADNHVMALLGAQPGTVLISLATVLGMSPAAATEKIQNLAARYLSRKAQDIPRGARMEAAQASALELLSTGAQGTIRQRAEIIWQDRYRASQLSEHAKAAPREIVNSLEESTFFTELRRPEHAALRALIWPAGDPARDADGYRRQFREEILRAQLLSTAARLGHAFIDLYVCAMAGRSTLVGRGAEEGGTADQLLKKYFDRLEAQRADPSSTWGALAELREIATHFDLIIDVNAPELKNAPLQESARLIASLLRRQQPVGGMAGQVNKSLVRQFRMPGYPLVLITTDVLQEGEDLHTFCSAIHHYGISWTPSAMEQRIGRIDRVRSQTDRRLSSLDADPQGEDWLQVYYPYLSDTVEVLQVDRVLDGMNKFLRLMHEELTTATQEQSKVDVAREILRARKPVEKIRSTLKSSFPVPDWALAGTETTLAVSPGIEKELRTRFAALRQSKLGSMDLDWAKDGGQDRLVGTVRLANHRVQPVVLLLRSDQGLPVIRCVSPIGRTEPDANPDLIAARATGIPSRIGAILTKEERTYDLTVEDDVLLGPPEQDITRVSLLIRRVAEHADFMEREHFQDGRDAALPEFEGDLRKEGDHEG